LNGGDTGVRNAVKVKWKNGEINVYKVGAGGKVDLKITEAGVGTDYYRDHLLAPGKISQSITLNTDICKR
jgi:hypothetical protein